MRRGTEGEHLNPVDRDPEADHQQAGEDSDEDGQNQEKPLIAIGR